MGSEDPVVSVVVPARDAMPTIGRTLAALRAQDLGRPFEVIVVDDGSRDGTATLVAAAAPFARLVRTEGGAGPGAARNRGVADARADVLAFTDADCFPAPGWLTAGLAALTDADLVQGAVAPDPAAARTPFDRTVSVGAERGFYETANLLVRRAHFERAGGFRDWVLEREAQRRRPRRWSEDRRRGRARRTPIGEDTAFAWAARRHGARTTFAPGALVHHAVVAGGLRDDLEDRWHWSRDMPGLARRVPELRDRCFYRRVFFHRRTADFDVAVAATAIAALARSPLPLVGVLPYARWVRRESAAWTGRARMRAAAGAVAGDGTTLAGLLTGSVAWRSLLL
jgi:glycosyltransferase involved in cell wall biosynthesis